MRKAIQKLIINQSIKQLKTKILVYASQQKLPTSTMEKCSAKFVFDLRKKEHSKFYQYKINCSPFWWRNCQQHFDCVSPWQNGELRYSLSKSCVPKCKFYEWLNGMQRHSWFYLDQGYGCEWTVSKTISSMVHSTIQHSKAQYSTVHSCIKARIQNELAIKHAKSLVEFAGMANFTSNNIAHHSIAHKTECCVVCRLKPIAYTSSSEYWI